MPGTTPLGLRYPLMGETVDATSWQNLANDVDALMTTIKGLRDKAFRTPTASVGSSLSPFVTSLTGVSTTAVFNTVNWDNTGTMVNLGVNNDRITVPPGIWYASFRVATCTNLTTQQSIRVSVKDLTAGTTWFTQATGNVSLGSANVGGVFGCAGLLKTTAASSAIGGIVQWIGTGGPANWNRCTLQVYRLRELVDV